MKKDSDYNPYDYDQVDCEDEPKFRISHRDNDDPDSFDVNQPNSDLSSISLEEGDEDSLSEDVSGWDKFCGREGRNTYQHYKDDVYYQLKQCKISEDFFKVNDAKTRFSRYVEWLNSGKTWLKNFALTSAVYELYLLGWNITNRKFGLYVNGNNKEDFESTFVMAIMDELPSYDQTKGAPSTFFSHKIFNALFVYVATFIMKVTEQEARKILLVNKIARKCREHGFDPEEGDIALEFTIKGVQNKSNAGYIRFYLFKIGAGSQDIMIEDKEDFDNYLTGDETTGSFYENPETQVMRKVIGEKVLETLKELARDKDFQIFMYRTQIINDATGENYTFEEIAELLYGDRSKTKNVQRAFDNYKKKARENPRLLEQLSDVRIVKEYYQKKENYLTNTDDLLDMINQAEPAILYSDSIKNFDTTDPDL